ncbi:MAG: hypothetical protein QOJ54_3669 [Aliidongia sp.]|jgi:hypothetical protein|nr:hypothetical protein [Aliidongia sp.]
MPFILPPPAFEVPAIIRVASHAPVNPAASHPAPPPARGTTVPAHPGPQPLDGVQNPQIVSPPAAKVPVPTTTTSSGWKR